MSVVVDAGVVKSCRRRSRLGRWAFAARGEVKGGGVVCLFEPPADESSASVVEWCSVVPCARGQTGAGVDLVEDNLLQCTERDKAANRAICLTALLGMTTYLLLGEPVKMISCVC